jgi:hypothetical protein
MYKNVIQIFYQKGKTNDLKKSKISQKITVQNSRLYFEFYECYGVVLKLINENEKTVFERSETKTLKFDLYGFEVGEYTLDITCEDFFHANYSYSINIFNFDKKQPLPTPNYSLNSLFNIEFDFKDYFFHQSPIIVEICDMDNNVIESLMTRISNDLKCTFKGHEIQFRVFYKDEEDSNHFTKIKNIKEMINYKVIKCFNHLKVGIMLITKDNNVEIKEMERVSKYFKMIKNGTTEMIRGEFTDGVLLMDKNMDYLETVDFELYINNEFVMYQSMFQLFDFDFRKKPRFNPMVYINGGFFFLNIKIFYNGTCSTVDGEREYDLIEKVRDQSFEIYINSNGDSKKYLMTKDIGDYWILSKPREIYNQRIFKKFISYYYSNIENFHYFDLKLKYLI